MDLICKMRVWVSSFARLLVPSSSLLDLCCLWSHTRARFSLPHLGYLEITKHTCEKKTVQQTEKSKLHSHTVWH